jgi:Uma2 family endonuclease
LHNGDRLTRDEFHRRYEAMPKTTRAELIEGVVYLEGGDHMPSPVRLGAHSKPHCQLVSWLASYVAYTPGSDAGDNGTIRLDTKNEVQPDAFAFITPECGGRVKIDADDYVVGGPDFVGEISASSASYDLHDKLEAYRRNGVREYVVWRVEDRAIDWFILRGDRYERLPPAADGLLKCEVFPGLWLDPKALLASNLRRVLEVVQAGVKSAEHAAFVEELERRRTKQL